MTQSEIDTMSYFNAHDISLKKIPETTYSTPDFFGVFNKQTVYFEVKELQENPEETKILNRIDKDKMTSNSIPADTDTKRIREKIHDAHKQLRKKCKNGEPGVLVLQDIRDFFVMGLNITENIKQAMFGDREIWRTMPHHTYNYNSKTTADNFGLNKKLRIDTNVFISAVALLIKNASTGQLSMLLFHNPFSQNSLEVKLLPKSELFKEFKINSTTRYNSFTEI